jgi:hypothetical protein
MREMHNAARFCSENLKERDYSKYVRIDKRIILKLIWKNQRGCVDRIFMALYWVQQ